MDEQEFTATAETSLEQAESTNGMGGKAPLIAAGEAAPATEGSAEASPDLISNALIQEGTEATLPEGGETAAETLEAGLAEGPEKSTQGTDQETGPERRWYVVHSYSGYENRVKKNLEQRIESMGMQDKIFQVVVPTEEEIEIRGGERRVVERRVFPGYVLVEMALDEMSWYVVRNTPGVTGFVGIGNRPTPLSAEEVEKIMKRIETAEPQIKVSFKVGQKVRVTEGAFADFVGLVDEVYPEKGKARVMVSLFGRDTPMEIDLLYLERV